MQAGSPTSCTGSMCRCTTDRRPHVTRPQIDTQEAELRAEQRRIQIERANKILFDETDRVKSFHSKMLLSDVMKENEQLVEVRAPVHVRVQACKGHVCTCACVCVHTCVCMRVRARIRTWVCARMGVCMHVRRGTTNVERRGPACMQLGVNVML